ncbi:MAG: YkgJ family cysteine cluster protein [Longimicrobiales bacterium]|nr:YkgJ family cysteine cluster protein [Longimicrobiales bacterium]
MGVSLPVFYNCLRCPAYCCTYPQIPVTGRDVRRLASHFGIPEEKARKRFTRKGEEKGTRVLRHRDDGVFDSACMFLDRETRGCTIYDVRPTPCRAYPGTARCGYYDFLASERRRQEDEDLVITAWVADV